MKNRIVITGSSGFLGSHLVERLRQLSFRNLVLIDRQQSEKAGKHTMIAGSFSDTHLLSRVLKKRDIVIHLACSSIPAVSEADHIRDIEENVIGTIKLLDACVKNKISKFIYLSSGGTVYGDHGHKEVKEDDYCRPMNAHGLMKLTTEKFVEFYGRFYKLNYVIVRPGNFYGRLGDINRKQGAVDVFLHKALNRQSIEIWGDGEITRDYIFIDDAVNFLIKTITKPVQGVFNIGTGRGVSINQLVKLINKITGRRAMISYKEKRKFDVPYIVLNSDKAKKVLGWKPKVRLEDGIAKLYRKIL